jgi:hypothetical protein
MRLSLTAMLTACLFSAGVASAAPFPPSSDASSGSNDFQITHSYQQYAATTCTAQGDCGLTFPATTTGTLILNASCNFQLSSGVIGAAQLGIQSADPKIFVQVFSFSTGNYGINSSTYLHYAKGQQPRIDVFSSGGTVQNLVCTVSGYQR